MTIQVEIMPCGTKAKELNPLGQTKWDAESNFELFPLPICFDAREELKELNIRKMRIERDWQQAESERKEYEIDVKESVCYCFDCPFPCDKHKPGTIHPGIIVNNKIKIV